MRCTVCCWQMAWRAYHRTFQRRQLNPGGAVEPFRAFVNAYERAGSPKEKMLAIDRLIHEFHYSLRGPPDRPTRPAGVNLIVGDLEDVAHFLDKLNGLNLPAPLRETTNDWRQKFQSTYWPNFLQHRRPAPHPPRPRPEPPSRLLGSSASVHLTCPVLLVNILTIVVNILTRGDDQ